MPMPVFQGKDPSWDEQTKLCPIGSSRGALNWSVPKKYSIAYYFSCCPTLCFFLHWFYSSLMMLILHVQQEKLKFQMQSGSGRMGLGLPHAILLWGKEAGQGMLQWTGEKHFCDFSFGLDQDIAHILCSTSTHLQHEITLIFHLVEPFLFEYC